LKFINNIILQKTNTELKFIENISQQFTSPCNVNHGKYMKSQSNDVAAREIEKSHMAFSHDFLTWVESISHQ
jgi:hypothetical protein